METNLTYIEVIEGYNNFTQFISIDFNKQLLINTVENYIKSPEWPRSYYNLRGEALPAIIGEEASKFFFWFALGGDFSIEEEFEYIEKDLSFLNYIRFNYSKTFINAKRFNINPLGFNEVNFTHGEEKDRFNLYLSRNDNNQFYMRNNALEFTTFISESLYYFKEMLLTDAIDFSEDIENIYENLEAMEGSLSELFNKLMFVTQNEEKKNE